MHWSRRQVALGAGAAIGCGLAEAQARPASSRGELFDAFAYLFTLYEVARLAHQSAQRGGRNMLNHRRGFADARARTITTPNNDTLYSASFLDLAAGPMLVTIPDCFDRYFSVAFMDAFTNNFRIIGTRATSGRGGRFLLTPPSWRGRAPAGVTRVDAPTQDVWMLARILADPGADLTRAHAIQDQFAVSPFSSSAAPSTAPAATSLEPDAEAFFDNACAMLARAGRGNPDRQRFARHRRFGVAPGARFASLDPTLQDQWRASLPDMRARLKVGIGQGASLRNGWSVPKSNLGDFGDDDHFRAAVALGGIAALPPVEAMYLTATRDADSALLSGERVFTWRIPAGGVPVNAFWSLSMYQVEPDGRLFFVDNPIQRFAIGDRTPGLQREADGALTVAISNRPAGEGKNWLPSPPGAFRLVLRAYLPKQPFVTGRWAPAPIVRSV